MTPLSAARSRTASPSAATVRLIAYELFRYVFDQRQGEKFVTEQRALRRHRHRPERDQTKLDTVTRRVCPANNLLCNCCLLSVLHHTPITSSMIVLSPPSPQEETISAQQSRSLLT
jgi:hypothetical protein